MSSVYRESIIQITSRNPENRSFGTGFLIYKNPVSSFFVTCAHVVTDVGGESKINVNGVPGEIIFWGSGDELDLAILKTNGYLDKPPLELGIYGLEGSPIIVAGFYIFGKHFSIIEIEGKLGKQIELVSRHRTDRIQTWDFKIIDETYLQDGFSGAPIIDKETTRVIGVVSYKQGDGQRGRAISIEELEKVWQEMPANLIKRWDDRKTYKNYNSLLFARATRLRIKGKLREALQLLREIKELAPTYPDIDTRIQEVERELTESYVDSSGQINTKYLYLQKLQQLRRFFGEDVQLGTNKTLLINILQALLTILMLVALAFLMAWLKKVLG